MLLAPQWGLTATAGERPLTQAPSLGHSHNYLRNKSPTQESHRRSGGFTPPILNLEYEFPNPVRRTSSPQPSAGISHPTRPFSAVFQRQLGALHFGQFAPNHFFVSLFSISSQLKARCPRGTLSRNAARTVCRSTLFLTTPLAARPPAPRKAHPPPSSSNNTSLNRRACQEKNEACRKGAVGPILAASDPAERTGLVPDPRAPLSPLTPVGRHLLPLFLQSIRLSLAVRLWMRWRHQNSWSHDMNQDVHQNDNDEMRPEYDFPHGVRGRHYKAYRGGTNVVFLDVRPGVKEHYFCRCDEQRPHRRGRGEKLYRSSYMQ